MANELTTLNKEETRVIRLNDANIYRCTFTFFIDRGFQHPFYLIERMTDEVIRAEKKAYEKVIRMIAHEVNNTTAGITSTLDTVEEALSTEKGMEEICDVMRVCTERCFSMSKFITRFADVVKIPEPVLTQANLNETANTCVRFMEGLCNDHHIKLTLQCAPDVKYVNLDSALFEQVLVNIIKTPSKASSKTVKSESPLQPPPPSKWPIMVRESVKRLKKSCSVLSSPPNLMDKALASSSSVKS